MMGGIGAHSPGMVVVCEAGALHRYSNSGVVFREISPLTAENPIAGRISGANPAPKKRLVWRLGSSFLGVRDFAGAPSSPPDKWVFKNTWGFKHLALGSFFAEI